jgi:hypothetical protein
VEHVGVVREPGPDARDLASVRQRAGRRREARGWSLDGPQMKWTPSSAVLVPSPASAGRSRCCGRHRPPSTHRQASHDWLRERQSQLQRKRGQIQNELPLHLRAPCQRRHDRHDWGHLRAPWAATAQSTTYGLNSTRLHPPARQPSTVRIMTPRIKKPTRLNCADKSRRSTPIADTTTHFPRLETIPGDAPRQSRADRGLLSQTSSYGRPPTRLRHSAIAHLSALAHVVVRIFTSSQSSELPRRRTASRAQAPRHGGQNNPSVRVDSHLRPTAEPPISKPPGACGTTANRLSTSAHTPVDAAGPTVSRSAGNVLVISRHQPRPSASASQNAIS